MGIGTGLGVEHVVPPAEAGSVVANELFVVNVVVLGASPDRQEVAQAPGEVVAAVGVDGLEETEGDPDVHGQEVKLAGDGEDKDGRSDDTDTEETSLNGRSVLSSQTERSRVKVVHLVDASVERAVVKSAVEPVVPGVFHDEEESNLPSHGEDRGERDAVVHAEVGGNGVEEPDLRQFGGEVADEDDGGAIPLLLQGGDLLVLNLVLVEVRDLVHDHERNAAAEVDDLVHEEAEETGRQSIVVHPQVPSLSERPELGFIFSQKFEEEKKTYRPETLKQVQVNIVFANFLEDVEVGLRLVQRAECRVPIKKVAS